MAFKIWNPFSSNWASYCKNKFKQLCGSDQCAHFSEGLLNTIYYETDVGCIPRGINLDATTQPKYFKSENWNKQISRCYWCRGGGTEYNGICCSKECFFYLHDWCVERVVYFTGRRFCRLPGCDSNTENNQLYCDDTDRAKFDSLFPKRSDHDYTVTTDIQDGPRWYDSKENFVTHSQNNNNSHYKMENTKTSSISPFRSDFPTELQELISLQTDIGIIPRGSFNLFHSQPKFSQYPNWSTPIKGCYYCGRIDIIDSTNKYFCRVRCYLLFYEWCRSKVKSVTGIRFCRYAGCAKRASEGHPCCNNGHEIDSNKLYKDNSIDDIVRVSSITPKWYTKSYSPNELVPHLSFNLTNSQTPPHYTPPPQQPNCGPNFVFSSELTNYLYYHTDVGPIPREIISHRSPSVPLLTNITMCYWCCQGARIFNTIACSLKCLFLFNEWLHRIYETSSNQQLCKSIGCNSLRYPGFKCCNREHSYSYDLSFEKLYPSLKSTEFALGPIWYTNSKITRIEFYNSEDPFYEFTNFYPCDDLYIDGLRWRTSEHYFQAMKFYGTPYFKYVSTLNSPRDAFQFSRQPEATKWLHPQWPRVKLQVMLKVLWVKFSSNYFRTILLRTGNAMLVEHTKNDKFWGDGGDGYGENKLGILLMQVRREIQTTSKYPLYQQNPMLQNNIDNQTLPPCVVNTQNTNFQNGGSNTGQQKVLPNSPLCLPKTNAPSLPSQPNTPSLPSQPNTPSHPSQPNTSSRSPQPSAPPLGSSNTNSKRISNVDKRIPSTNPFDNQLHKESCKTTKKVEEFNNVTPGQKLGYYAKHDLPKDYRNPFSPSNPGSVEMETDKNVTPPLTISLENSKGKSPENSPTNLCNPGSHSAVVNTCGKTNFDPFEEFLPNNSDPIQSKGISNDEDSDMETEQIDDSSGKDKRDQSNSPSIAKNQSDLGGQPHATSHKNMMNIIHSQKK